MSQDLKWKFSLGFFHKILSKNNVSPKPRLRRTKQIEVQVYLFNFKTLGKV